MNEKKTEQLNEGFLLDLASEALGTKVIGCSDEWFAAASNLIKPGRGIFKEGYFVETGQWMDGWESRRSYGRERPLDYDWCTLKLGIRGQIHHIDIDTNHFRGNAPEYASVEAAFSTAADAKELVWHEILAKSPLNSNSQNPFDINSDQVWTHLRLNIYPDGGVARLKVYGDAVFCEENYIDGELIDLAAIKNGGKGIACSDMFYSSVNNMLMPRQGVNMGDGWETKRRRDQNNDWAIIHLGKPGSIRKVIVDTAHFKGNYPDTFSLHAATVEAKNINYDDMSWQTVIPQTKLSADSEHIFINELLSDEECNYTHVKLNIYPDGGVSRLRIFGFVNESEVSS